MIHCHSMEKKKNADPSINPLQKCQSHDFGMLYTTVFAIAVCLWQLCVIKLPSSSMGRAGYTAFICLHIFD